MSFYIHVSLCWKYGAITEMLTLSSHGGATSLPWLHTVGDNKRCWFRRNLWLGWKMEKCWIIRFLSGNSRSEERKRRSRVGKKTTTKSNHESLEVLLLLLFIMRLQEIQRTHSGFVLKGHHKVPGGLCSTDAREGFDWLRQWAPSPESTKHWFSKELCFLLTS